MADLGAAQGGELDGDLGAHFGVVEDQRDVGLEAAALGFLGDSL